MKLKEQTKVITIQVKNSSSFPNKKRLGVLLNNHFNNTDIHIIKDIDEPGGVKWIIGTSESISKQVNDALNITL